MSNTSVSHRAPAYAPMPYREENWLVRWKRKTGNEPSPDLNSVKTYNCLANNGQHVLKDARTLVSRSFRNAA